MAKHLLFWLLICLSACDQFTKKETPEPIIPVVDGSGAILADLNLMGETILAMIDEGVATLAVNPDPPYENVSANSASVEVTISCNSLGDDPDPQQDPATAAAKVVFPLELIGEQTKITETYTRKNETVQVLFSSDDNRKHIFSASDKPLQCDPDKDIIDLTGYTIPTLKLTARGTRSKSLTLTTDLAAPATGQLKSERDYQSAGEWKVAWTKNATTTGGKYFWRADTTQVNVTKQLITRDKDKKLRQMNGTIITEKMSPLLAENVRSMSNLVNWVQSTIDAGTLNGTWNDGTKVVLRFLFLQFAPEDPCYPRGGSVDGSVFKTSTDTKPAITFNLIFDDNKNASITFSNGDKYPFSFGGCDLEPQIAGYL